MRATSFGMITLFLACACFAFGCGEDDPEFVTDQIGINLTLKENNVVDTQVEERKNVSTESTNPYAKFLGDINAKFGQDPVDIRVEAVQVQLMEAKDDVSALEDLFSGTTVVFLAPDDVAAGYDVATHDALEGAGPLEMDLTGDSLDAFQATLRSETFRVGIRAPTPRAASDKFEAKTAVTLTFGAYAK